MWIITSHEEARARHAAQTRGIRRLPEPVWAGSRGRTRPASAKHRARRPAHTVLSLVQTSTRTVWSSTPMTASPSLSAFQSKEATGCAGGAVAQVMCSHARHYILAAHLRREGLLLQLRHGAEHALVVPVLLLDLALRRVRVLPQLERAVAAARHEDVAVLGQVAHAPDGRLVRLLREEGEAVHRVLRPHVVHSVPAT